ncbi:MAG: biosynthetic arginine decarboxylase, partial [Chlamydiae bacterium]|nr:biosynthetic arginine decarboxylase [Chlamydiota bacterium]
YKRISLYEVVNSLKEKGINPPILFRFEGIIEDRIHQITSAFEEAILQNKYKNLYRLAFPVKVNQQREVIEAIRTAKKGISLEVGSKPELLGVLCIHDNENGLLLCNGYKDEEFIELALLSKKIGRRPIIIIEQFDEIQLVLKVSARLSIEAEIGFRMKPHTKGSGKWASSSGEATKFGLNIYEIVKGIHLLKNLNKQGWVKLLHYHMGSQITSIGCIEQAMQEASRLFVEIAKLCPTISFFDVGGGLGVDYEGSHDKGDFSLDYTLKEYANTIVSIIKKVCDASCINHPEIISESGRAIVAHHSILVTQVMSVTNSMRLLDRLDHLPSENSLLKKISDLFHKIAKDTVLQDLKEAIVLKEQVVQSFIKGDLTLVERGFADFAYNQIILKILMFSKDLNDVPSQLYELDHKLVDVYYCNFSLFRSLTDSWAIDQIFPVMPLNKLDKQPTQKAIIVDITCDSDGKIDKFVSAKGVSKTLLLHEFDTSPYYLGLFLVGAYQEILGGFHNLFGDTNVVHIDVLEDGSWSLKHD